MPRRLREYDIAAGHASLTRTYPGGYTSYGSMAHLQKFSSTFATLEKSLLRHVRAFARALELDLRGHEIHLTDCWANIMPPTAAHSLHLHPLSVISGTYCSSPRRSGCPGLKFEDPRLDRFMAAPPAGGRANRTKRTSPTPPGRARVSPLFGKAGCATSAATPAWTPSASASVLTTTGLEVRQDTGEFSAATIRGNRTLNQAPTSNHHFIASLFPLFLIHCVRVRTVFFSRRLRWQSESSNPSR